jgi:hypothetical protein
VARTGSKLTVILNANHPFFVTFYRPAKRVLPKHLGDILDALLISLARTDSDLASRGEDKVLRAFRLDWSNWLAALVETK